MASKNLKEVEQIVFCLTPSFRARKAFKDELQDFLGHEIMRLKKGKPLDYEPSAQELFNRVFKEESN